MPYKGYGYAAKVCCSKVYNINRSVTRAPFLKYCVRKTEQGHSHITYLDRKNVDCRLVVYLENCQQISK